MKKEKTLINAHERDYMRVGARTALLDLLEMRRINLGLNIYEVYSTLRISRQTLSNWTSGRVAPRGFEELVRLKHFLQFKQLEEVYELFGFKESDYGL